MIPARYPHEPMKQHAFTIFVVEQRPVAEAAFRSRAEAADVIRWADEDGWEDIRRDVKDKVVEFVGRGLSELALQRALPFATRHMDLSEALSRRAQGVVDDPDTTLDEVMVAARIAEKSLNLGQGVLALGGITVRKEAATPPANPVQVNILNQVYQAARQAQAPAQAPAHETEVVVEVADEELDLEQRR